MIMILFICSNNYYVDFRLQYLEKRVASGGFDSNTLHLPMLYTLASLQRRKNTLATLQVYSLHDMLTHIAE